MLSTSTAHKSLLDWLDTVVVEEFPTVAAVPPAVPTLPPVLAICAATPTLEVVLRATFT